MHISLIIMQDKKNLDRALDIQGDFFEAAIRIFLISHLHIYSLEPRHYRLSRTQINIFKMVE